MKIYDNFMFLECSECKNRFMIIKDKKLLKRMFCPYCSLESYLEQIDNRVLIVKTSYMLKRI